MNNGKELFIKYKELTLEIEKFIESNNVDNIQILIDERQNLLSQMEVIDKQQARKWIKELSIKEDHERVGILIEEKKRDIRLELHKLQESKKINIGYNNRNKSGLYFSQKI